MRRAQRNVGRHRHAPHQAGGACSPDELRLAQRERAVDRDAARDPDDQNDRTGLLRKIRRRELLETCQVRRGDGRHLRRDPYATLASPMTNWTFAFAGAGAGAAIPSGGVADPVGAPRDRLAESGPPVEQACAWSRPREP